MQNTAGCINKQTQDDNLTSDPPSALYRILFDGITDALPDVCARTHPVGGLLLRLVAAGGRLARGLAAGGGWGGQERWLLAKRRPF